MKRSSARLVMFELLKAHKFHITTTNSPPCSMFRTEVPACALIAFHNVREPRSPCGKPTFSLGIIMSGRKLMHNCCAADVSFGLSTSGPKIIFLPIGYNLAKW